MVVKISVVVPVFNPGPHLQPLLDSLAAQTLPADEFEAIFVDDGSTDATPALLDRLAATHPNLHVIHQENSGWPGKPRNVGIEAARGEYVFFSDNDDWLGTEALDRMYAMARRNDADIVIGKMVGHRRGVPRVLFRKTVERATLADTPLIDSLTPHKLFRRAFLDEHALRFPEGRRRLEDHVFVVRAYFCANVISVLADYPCYHHIRRDDATNAGYTDINPPGYYGYVRETLDIVDRYTEPGDFRDRLLRRFLRQELLGRLDGRLPELEPGYRELLFGEIHRLIVERFPDTVDAGLPARQRLLAAAARAGDLAGTVRLAEWSASVSQQPRLLDLGWDDGTLQLSWEVRLGTPDGLLIEEVGSRLRLRSPAGVTAAEPVDVTDEVAAVRAGVVARQRATGEEVYLPTTTGTGVEHGSLLVSGSTRLAPEHAAGGGALVRGVWDVSLRFAALGWSADVRLGKHRAAAAEDHCRPAFVGSPARVALPYWTVPHGNLSLALDGAVKALQPVLDSPRGGARLEAGPGALVAVVEVPAVTSGSTRGQVRLSRPQSPEHLDVSVTLEPAGESTSVRTDRIPIGRSSPLPRGRYALSLLLRDAAGSVPLGVVLTIPRLGRPRIRRIAGQGRLDAATTGGSVPVRGRRYAKRRLSALRRRARGLARPRTGATRGGAA